MTHLKEEVDAVEQDMVKTLMALSVSTTKKELSLVMDLSRTSKVMPTFLIKLPQLNSESTLKEQEKQTIGLYS